MGEEQGMAEERIATPRPMSRSFGSRRAYPPMAMPMGRRTSVPTHNEITSPVPPGNAPLTLALRSM
jgi:hypothetical protein